MDTLTVFAVSVAHMIGRAATGCRPSVAYRTREDKSQAVSEAFT